MQEDPAETAPKSQTICSIQMSGKIKMLSPGELPWRAAFHKQGTITEKAHLLVDTLWTSLGGVTDADFRSG